MDCCDCDCRLHQEDAEDDEDISSNLVLVQELRALLRRICAVKWFLIDVYK